MSQYTELSRLGSLRSQKIFAVRRECQRFAQRLMARLAAHWEFPPDNIVYYSINKDMKFTDRQHKLSEGWPKLEQRNDGFWYFGVEFQLKGIGEFSYSSMYSVFGMNTEHRNFLMRYEKTFTLGPEEDTSWIEFFDYLYSDYKEDLEKPLGQQKRRIGFHGDTE